MEKLVVKAISSARDYELYEAIRLLSILKKKQKIPRRRNQKAEEQVDFLQNNMGELSEMSRIRNLHWWTVEYGLIGTVDNPKFMALDYFLRLVKALGV